MAKRDLYEKYQRAQSAVILWIVCTLAPLFIFILGWPNLLFIVAIMLAVIIVSYKDRARAIERELWDNSDDYILVYIPSYLFTFVAFFIGYMYLTSS